MTGTLREDVCTFMLVFYGNISQIEKCFEQKLEGK